MNDTIQITIDNVQVLRDAFARATMSAKPSAGRPGNPKAEALAEALVAQVDAWVAMNGGRIRAGRVEWNAWE